MSDKTTPAAFPVGSRVTIGHDKRTLGTVEAYELGNGVGRPFVRCDDGMGYWCERFQLVSAGPTREEQLESALGLAVAVISDYLSYAHDGDPWKEDARLMGEMEINDYGRDGRLSRALDLLGVKS